MKKSNVRSTVDQQTRILAKRARRLRRKAKLEALVLERIKPLRLVIGQLQQQIANLTKEKK